MPLTRLQSSGAAPAPAASGSGPGLLAPRSKRLIFNDFFVPVVTEGLAFGVAQVATTDATGRFFCATHGTAAAQVISALDSSKVATYDQASVAKVGAFAIKGPGGNAFFTPKQPGTTGQDKSWGEPGMSARSFVVNNGTAGTAFRVTIRWYRVVGVRDVLYCELDISPDKSSTANTIQAGAATAISVSHMVEGKVDTSTGVTMAYDAALDGISLRTGGTDERAPSWLFMRALSHPSSGHYYETAEQNDQYFATGALPTGTDSLPLTGTAGTPAYYRGHLAMQSPSIYTSHAVFRYAVGIGYSEAEAKRKVTNIPNMSAAQARDMLASKIASRTALRTSSLTEATAWDSIMHMLIHNERTEQDWHPETAAYDGTPRRILWGGLGRWNAAWGYDSAYYMLLSGVDPQMARDMLDYMLNAVMDQTTGYVRIDPKSQAQGGFAQHGALLYARALRRYLAATGDTAFASTAYDKVKLLHNFWQTTAGRQHPNWPTVHMLTGIDTTEIGENTPITRVGGTGADTLLPDGDLKTTAYAYDLCVHMAAMATTLGKPAGDVTFFNAEAAAYLASLRNNCWNSTLGWYVPIGRAYDTNGTDPLKQFNVVKSLHGFHMLWMGIPTPAQAATMRAAIIDPNQFNGTYGLRTAPKNWVGYQSNNWTLGGSRPYHTAAAISGLLRYGYSTDAETLLKPWTTVLATRGTCPESNDPDLNQPGVSRFFDMTAALADVYVTMRMPELQFGVGIDTVTS